MTAPTLPATLGDELDSIARVSIYKNGTLIGSRRRVDLVEGTNTTLTITDDGVNEKITVTITGVTNTEDVQDIVGALGLGGAGLTFTYNDAANTAVIDVNVDSTTIEIVADTLRIAASAAGNGLTGGGGSALAVNPGNGTILTGDAVDVDWAMLDMVVTESQTIPTGYEAFCPDGIVIPSGNGVNISANSGLSLGFPQPPISAGTFTPGLTQSGVLTPVTAYADWIKILSWVWCRIYINGVLVAGTAANDLIITGVPSTLAPRGAQGSPNVANSLDGVFHATGHLLVPGTALYPITPFLFSATSMKVMDDNTTSGSYWGSAPSIAFGTTSQIAFTACWIAA